MKFTSILKKAFSRISPAAPCNLGISPPAEFVHVAHASPGFPACPNEDGFRLAASGGSRQAILADRAAARYPKHRQLPILQSTRTVHLPTASIAVDRDELMLDSPIDPHPLKLISSDSPTLGKHAKAFSPTRSSFGDTTLATIPEENSTIQMSSEDYDALHAEFDSLRYFYTNHQAELIDLQTSLEVAHNINYALKQSARHGPRKLKQLVATLTAQLHDKEIEIEEWRQKFATLAWTAGVRGEISKTKEMLEGSVSELEAQAELWRGRLEEVARMGREVERKGRGLGMWWQGEGSGGRLV